MANITTLAVNRETASGVDAFVRDLDTPSKALLSLQDSVSTEVQTEGYFDYTEEKEEKSTEGWDKKFGIFGAKAKNPCGDGFVTTCGDWHIEIKREKPDERNPVCNNEATEAEATREEISRPTEINVPKAEDSENEKKEIPTEKVVKQTEEVMEDKATEDDIIDEQETWLDQISSHAHGMCAIRSDTISPQIDSETPDSKETEKFDVKKSWLSFSARMQTVFSRGMSPLRQATGKANQAEEMKEPPIAKYTEMALNGDHEEVTVVTELMEQEKQMARDKETAREKSNMVEQMTNQAKIAWLFVSQKIMLLSKSQVDGVAAKGTSESVSAIETVNTDELTGVKTEARSPVAREAKAPSAEQNGKVPEDIISLASEALSSIQDSIVEPQA